MAISFDDLVPNDNSQTNNNGINFDDLIPEQNQNQSSAIRLAAMGGSNSLEGAASTLGLPGNVADLYNRYLGSPFARIVSGQDPQFGTPDQGAAKIWNAVLPTSNTLVSSLNDAGLTNRSDLQPTTPFEKYYAAATKGLGGSGPLALVAGAPMAALQMLAQGIGGGIGEQAAQDTMPDNKYASLFGSLAGGIGGGGVASGVEKSVNAINGSSPILQAYKLAGVTPTMVGDLTQNPTMQRIQALGGNTKAAQAQLDDFGDSVNSLANNLGDSHSLQEAGQSLQSEGKKWLNNWKDQKQLAYNDLDQAMSQNTIPLTNLQNTISSIKSAASDNENLKRFLSSSLSNDVDNIVSSATPRIIPQRESFPITEQPIANLPWSGVKALRSRIGEYLENPTLVADAPTSQAKQMYAALSKDMENAATLSPNPNALPMFQNANAITSQGHQFVENVLQPIMDKDASSAASSALTSGTKGGETLQAIRQNMPKAADELAAVSLRRRMAGQSEGALGNAVSPSQWLSSADPTRRLSPEAYDALYPDPDTQQKMAALDTVAHNMRATESFANHSNTASHASLYAALPMGMEGAYRGYEMAGLPGALAGGVAGVGLPFAIKPAAGALSSNASLARFMASPSTAGKLGRIPSLLPAVNSMPFSLAPQQGQ